MAAQNGPGSVISIGSSSEDEQPSIGTKRPRDDDSDDDTSSSGSSRSESPGSRIDAVSKSRKGAKRQKGVQKSVEASSPEEGEMSEDEPFEPMTRRVTRSQSRRAESPEKQQSKESQSSKASKQKKKKNKKNSREFALPDLEEPDPGETWEACFEAWYRTFITDNRIKSMKAVRSITKNKKIDEIPIGGNIGAKGRAPLKKAVKTLHTSGRLEEILQEMLESRDRGDQGQSTESGRQGGTSENIISVPSDSEEEYEPTLGAVILDTGKGSHQFLSTANGSSTLPADGNGVILNSNVPVGDEALQQQRRYFPSASDPGSMCLLCGRSGHAAPTCPHLACRFCNSKDHADFSCPSRVRCDKCRQLGHSSKVCTEKLALTKDEGLACSFCSGNDHTEPECTELWRSFHPEQEKLHTVAFIPPTCSSCGVEGEHYSGDCHNLSVKDTNPTWTLRNHDRYVDAQSEERSIEQNAALADGAPRARAPEMKIRGHSKTQHIQFHDSDSETDFLGRAPARGRAPIGQIRMSSNIQMPSDSRGANTRGRGPPPLPPGPPPPGPPPRRQDERDWQQSFVPPPPPGAPRYDSGPRGPPPNLPNRPPPQKSYHHVPPPASHRQSSGGRGGGKHRGGRRGGRGRGGK
ncbi:zinc knuckle domain protein [Sarocladium implicatum]|nr:zinc knuckle domain protein [Sarocladium implicatum]